MSPRPDRVLPGAVKYPARMPIKKYGAAEHFRMGALDFDSRNTPM